MKLYRKLRKNSKALSPVVASIILIAVTVAVSVVVAAWMGGMTIGLMGSAEQVSITNIEFIESGTDDTMKVMVTNSGGTTVDIKSAFINGAEAEIAESSDTSLDKSTTGYITLEEFDGLDSGTAYTVKLITAKGTSAVYTATYNP